MRLWHESLIQKLPNAQLIGQHRECCALRGLGWGKKHSTVDYVFTHNPYKLVLYHFLIMDEMQRRAKWPNLDKKWVNGYYRGKKCKPWQHGELTIQLTATTIYPEHNDSYLSECLENLRRKGVYIE